MLREPVGIGRTHLHAVRVATVELGFHQGYDVDAVDPQVVDLPADVHVHQGCATDHGPGQIDQVEARVGEVDVVEPGVGEVNVLEPRARQVLAGELSHQTSLTETQSRSSRRRRAVAAARGRMAR